MINRLAAGACALIFNASLLAQNPSPALAGAKASAPIDLTGYWVSIVTEDWRYRMLNAPKGDYYSLPINDAARKVADTWDPDKARSQDACVNYGAPMIMRVPGRVHITWESENAMRVETDAGKQTRLFSFARSVRPSAQASLQGVSLAEWQTPQGTRAYLSKLSAQDPNTPGFAGIFHGQGAAPPPPPPSATGTLKVVTNHLKPGQLRNNGVPYSADVSLIEYYDVHKEPNGDQWLVITTVVDDPQYLNVPWVTTTHFRREPDGSKWDPEPCYLILPSK